MPEVKPVWIDGYYDNYDQAYAAAQEGMNGDLLEGIPQQALTLDQIDDWLRRVRVEPEEFDLLARLLAQVQAWKEGKA